MECHCFLWMSFGFLWASWFFFSIFPLWISYLPYAFALILSGRPLSPIWIPFVCLWISFLFLSDELYSFFSGVSVVSYDFPLFLYSFL